MIWGAVAGTVPDLDVVAGLVADPITNLAFHRCVTHSLYYAALATPILAWMARALYPADADRPPAAYPWRVWLPGLLALYGVLAIGSLASPTPLAGVWTYAAVVAGATAGVPLAVWALRQIRPRGSRPRASSRHWLALFGLGIGTHPLLDCFTTYGTQVLQPFAELRVAWSTISVVDPAYTLPFLLLVLIASRVARRSPLRRYLVVGGLALSTAYLAFTVHNHRRIRRQIGADLAAAGIPHERFLATPTLLNNVLWNVVVDQGDTLLTAQLGLLDEPFSLPVAAGRGSPLQAHPRREELLAGIRDERAVRVATWFSQGYYSVGRAAGDTLTFVDLRFGSLPLEDADPVFAFQLYPRSDASEWGLRQNRVSNDDLDAGAILRALWRRIQGTAPERPPATSRAAAK